MKPEQLEQYRKKLQEHNSRLREGINDLTEEISSEQESDSNESKEAEVVVEQVEESIQQDVQAALLRIKAGTFGTCVDCGGKIIRARLDAIPYTPVCIGCETKREAGL